MKHATDTRTNYISIPVLATVEAMLKDVFVPEIAEGQILPYGLSYKVINRVLYLTYRTGRHRIRFVLDETPLRLSAIETIIQAHPVSANVSTAEHPAPGDSTRSRERHAPMNNDQDSTQPTDETAAPAAEAVSEDTQAPAETAPATDEKPAEG